MGRGSPRPICFGQQPPDRTHRIFRTVFRGVRSRESTQSTTLASKNPKPPVSTPEASEVLDRLDTGGDGERANTPRRAAAIRFARRRAQVECRRGRFASGRRERFVCGEARRHARRGTSAPTYRPPEPQGSRPRRLRPSMATCRTRCGRGPKSSTSSISSSPIPVSRCPSAPRSGSSMTPTICTSTSTRTTATRS